MRRLLPALAVVLLLVRPAFAWGPDGHEVIATIAEKALSSTARKQVRLLLPAKMHSLAEIANWADAVRPSRPWTAEWHFVDIPLDAQGYDRARDCKHDDCVVEQVNTRIQQLSDRSLLPAVRLEALKFLVHFVGDMHQPLHCADNHDRGGNDVKVIFEGSTVRLHRVWDSGIINSAVPQQRDYAARLFRSASMADRQSWVAKRTPVDWANECFAIGKADIYTPLGLIGHPGPHTTAILLPPDYAATRISIVQLQLQRAGFRLAAVLEASLARSFWRSLVDWR
jgi:hypothetical protein